MNGFPVFPSLQVQIGLWFTTRQLVFCPQGRGQGFTHFWFMQALFEGQSELTTHSGRHEGGFPVYSGRQEHTALPETTRHWLFGPQGDGIHGFVSSSDLSEKYEWFKLKYCDYIIILILSVSNWVTWVFHKFNNFDKHFLQLNYFNVRKYLIKFNINLGIEFEKISWRDNGPCLLSKDQNI